MYPLDDHSTKSLLDIKDDNLTFLSYYFDSDHVTKVLVAQLALPLTHCPVCQTALVRNGHYVTKSQFLSINASKPIKIELHKQRLLCQHCHHTYLAQTTLVNKYCSIAQPVKQKILHDLQEDRSMTAIAQVNNVSANTVLRTLKHFAHQPQAADYEQLPEHLGVDEFRGVGRQLHFICVDGETHKIIKILSTRLKQDILTYFEKFPLIVRSKVKTVTMDLNAYYQGLARVLFPNAQIIIDRFHIVQMLNRSFNQLRVQTMKQFKHSDRRYILLKYYWKLYLKPFNQLELKQVKYYRHLKQPMTQGQIVSEGLDASTQLRAAYDFIQDFYQALCSHNCQKIATLFKCKANLGPQLRTTLQTFRRNRQAVLNAATSSYSNGCVEGTNRKIKQIERTAYGYRNFNNLVTRIMLESKNAVIKENTLSTIA